MSTFRILTSVKKLQLRSDRANCQRISYRAFKVGDKIYRLEREYSCKAPAINADPTKNLFEEPLKARVKFDVL